MVVNKLAHIAENLKKNWEDPNGIENLGSSEKILSVTTGALIFLKGIGNLLKHPIIGVAEVAIGSGLLYRGLTGYCPIKDLTEEEPKFPIFVRETFIAENPPF